MNQSYTATITYFIGPIPALLNDVVGCASDVIMLITVPLYILVLLAIIKNRKDEWLKHSFFTLMISIGIADICKIVTLLLFTKLAGYGWVPELFIWMDSWAARLALSFGMLTRSSVAGVLFVTMNRFTAFIVPMRHEQLWDGGRMIRYCIVLQWIYALVVAAPIALSSQPFFNYFPRYPLDNKTITFAWDGAPTYNFWAVFVATEPVILAIVILYAIIFITIVKKKCVSKAKFSAIERVAFRMTMIGFLQASGIVVSQHVKVVSNLSWVLFKINAIHPTTFWFIINLGNLFFCSVNPYALLAFSTPVRKHFMRMFVPWYKENKQIAIRVAATAT